jgi:hypothetical protein
MATLNITELKNAASPIGTYAPDVPPFPAIGNQNVALSATSATGAQFNAATYALLLISDTDCHFVVGATAGVAVAGTTATYLPAKVPLIIAVPPQYYIAATTP